MNDVVVGYEIDRALVICIVCIILVLFLIQATSEFFAGWTTTRFSTRWTSHRLGPLACVMGILRAVDARQAFGVYTKYSKLSSWFFMGQLAFMYITSFAIVYGVVKSNARTARVMVSDHYAQGLFTLSVMTPFVVIGIMVAAYVEGTQAREYFFDAWCALAGCIVWSLFVYYGWQLRSILKANLDNPQLTRLAKKGFQKMNRALIATCVLLGAMNVYQIETAVESWGKLEERIGDPNTFRLIYIATDLLLTAGLLLLLWLTWIPVRFKCNSGPWHLPYTFLKTGGSTDGSDGTGSNKRHGSIQMKPSTPSGKTNAGATGTFTGPADNGGGAKVTRARTGSDATSGGGRISVNSSTTGGKPQLHIHVDGPASSTRKGSVPINTPLSQSDPDGSIGGSSSNATVRIVSAGAGPSSASDSPQPLEPISQVSTTVTSATSTVSLTSPTIHTILEDGREEEYTALTTHVHANHAITYGAQHQLLSSASSSSLPSSLPQLGVASQSTAINPQTTTTQPQLPYVSVPIQSTLTDESLPHSTVARVHMPLSTASDSPLIHSSDALLADEPSLGLDRDMPTIINKPNIGSAIWKQ